ncbi:MAG: DUF1003 domain-containing protein [Helcococcus sp.]|nr:DUF1003 domain-containing protein [Helcococcus sp.]
MSNKVNLIMQILDEDMNNEEYEEALELLLAETVNKIPENKMTKSQLAADKLAKFAGSWTFIIFFIIVLIGWIILNVYMLRNPFDPYPFILMNLVLSCIAAIQAPIIMMSQNRQEEKDRERAKNDYKVNLKSEILIEEIYRNINSINERLDKIENKENEYKKK